MSPFRPQETWEVEWSKNCRRGLDQGPTKTREHGEGCSFVWDSWKTGPSVCCLFQAFQDFGSGANGGRGDLSRSKGPFSYSLFWPGWRISRETQHMFMQLKKPTHVASISSSIFIITFLSSFISAHVLFPSVSSLASVFTQEQHFSCRTFSFICVFCCLLCVWPPSHHPVSVGGSSFPMSATHTHSKQTFTCWWLYLQVIHLIYLSRAHEGEIKIVSLRKCVEKTEKASELVRGNKGMEPNQSGDQSQCSVINSVHRQSQLSNEQPNTRRPAEAHQSNIRKPAEDHHIPLSWLRPTQTSVPWFTFFSSCK